MLIIGYFISLILAFILNITIIIIVLIFNLEENKYTFLYENPFEYIDTILGRAKYCSELRPFWAYTLATIKITIMLTIQAITMTPFVPLIILYMILEKIYTNYLKKIFRKIFYKD